MHLNVTRFSIEKWSFEVIITYENKNVDIKLMQDIFIPRIGSKSVTTCPCVVTASFGIARDFRDVKLCMLTPID